MAESILIIDDKEKLCISLAKNFERLGYRPLYALNGSAAIEKLRRHSVDAALLDISLGCEDGIDLLKIIRRDFPCLPVVMITGYGTIETAVEAIKTGAFDYIQKPIDFNRLLTVVENAVKMSRLEQENAGYRRRIQGIGARMNSASPAMRKLLDKAARLAETDLPILILGESGTGKELLASYIHDLSRRSAREMVRINCAAFPENLLDNELFGHEKGAYTGADSRFIGLFEKADASSLFLDEIADMPLPSQAKILRVLQNREIRRIGSTSIITVDVRFIAATHSDLEAMIEQRLFREDLYYRLNTAVLEIPPLRERKEDIPGLVERFLSEFQGSWPEGPFVEESVMSAFMNHDWPGNIREVKNVVQYAAAVSLNGRITMEDLPASFPRGEAVLGESGLLEETEKKLILRTLRLTGYNKMRAADMLKISRKTLYNKIDKYGLSG